MKFAAWMKKVDDWCWKLAGCSYEDLPDVCYSDMFADGASPKSAAKAAMSE